MSTEASGRTARSRRTGEEVRAALLAAARDVFAELGYVGASTKEIARRAGVGEVLLFRHFGSKAGLFDEAVLDQFQQLVEQWVARWSQRGLRGDSMEEIARDYVELFYGFFDDNRQLVVALFGARAHHPETAARLDGLFSQLESPRGRGWPNTG